MKIVLSQGKFNICFYVFCSVGKIISISPNSEIGWESKSWKQTLLTILDVTEKDTFVVLLFSGDDWEIICKAATQNF